MKSIRNIYVVVLVVLGVSMGNAQELEDNSLEVSTKKLEKEIVLDKKNTSDDDKNKNNYLLNNIVQISQVGYSNLADINVRSNNSKVMVSQEGANNYLEVYKNAKQLNQSFVQSGNNNFISDFSLYSDTPINMSLNQDGNNLTIYNNGSNSISKDLKINQTGNSGIIYIYNKR
jgi:hypothetical protein